MQCTEKDNIILIRLYPGEDLNNNIKKVCKKYNIKNGVILSGIGQLKEIRIGYFKEKNNYLQNYFKKTYELLSLTGNICQNNDDFILHLHVILGDDKKNTIGGHLIEGKVEVTNEIVIMKTNLNFTRKYEEKTGLKELFIK